MTNYLYLLLPMLLQYTAAAQDGEVHIKTAPLFQFIGEWEGKGFHKHDTHTNHYFQKTKIDTLLDGKLVVMEAKAVLAGQPEKVIHHSVTVWRYNEETGEYLSTNYRPDGRISHSSFTLEDGRMVSFSDDHAIKQVSFVNKSGAYISYWDREMKDGTRQRIFEFKLKKTSP